MATDERTRARREAPRRTPLRLLALAPSEPGGPTLELIGPHPLVACAEAARGRVTFTVVTDPHGAARFAALPPPHELVVAPFWRVVPRERLAPLAAAARLQAALACLAAAAASALARAPAHANAGAVWDGVHGWETAGALAAATAARALGLAWAWTPPRDGARGLDEHGEWSAAWAAREADLLLARDPAHAAAIREAWAPMGGRLALLPRPRGTGWDAAGDAAPAAVDRPRLALVVGAGATAAAAIALMRALASLRETAPELPPYLVIGVGCRLTPAAAAVRAESRRLGLLPGLAWRDLAFDAPLPSPRGELSPLAAAVVLGREAPPAALCAWLWRQGAAVTWCDPARADRRASEPPAPGSAAPPLDVCAPEPAALADRLARLAHARVATRLACRAAWRAAADGAAAEARYAPARLYARLALLSGHGGRG